MTNKIISVPLPIQYNFNQKPPIMAFVKYKQKSVRVALNQAMLLSEMEAAFMYGDDKTVSRAISADKELQSAMAAALRRFADREAMRGKKPMTPSLTLLQSAAGFERLKPQPVLQWIPASLMPVIAKAGYAHRIDAEKVAAMVAKIKANGHKIASLIRDDEKEMRHADFRECTPELKELIETMRPNEGDPRRSKTRLFFEKLSFAVKKGLHL